MFWQSIADSDQPALYQSYLEQYPNGTFAPLARAKLKLLRPAYKNGPGDHDQAPAARASDSNLLQIPAFLPDKSTIPATAPMAIDGIWTVSTIGKRVRIEGGRAYAVDSWLHLFVLRVNPGMVTGRNFRQTGPGTYTYEDLPLMARGTLKLNADGSLSAYLNGSGGEAFRLIPQQIDNPAALDAEVAAVTGGGHGRPYQPGYH